MVVIAGLLFYMRGLLTKKRAAVGAKNEGLIMR
jgi:hypothetical protein